MAGVLQLPAECHEAAQPAGGAVVGLRHLELEILAQVPEAAEHRGEAEPGAVGKPGGS